MLSADAARIAAAIPEYEVERELGRGGMGVVYLGRHRRLDRGVAIKELPRTFASEPEVRARFSTEAQTLAGLSHPHIVPIFDYVEREDLCLIVMEQLPGGTVWDRFTSTGLTPPLTCGVVMACCAALQYAHDKSVLHLDVKPDNLMFDAEAAVKVTDFGIARVITGDRTMGTVDGQVLGTPAYMSPEQARGDDLTPASDVYATGVMLYELLSGKLPWLGAETASELLNQRLHEDPISLSEAAPHVPAPLVAVAMQALSREADDRYQRAEDLGVAIGEACAASWGDDWLDHAGVAVFGSGRLNRAARTSGVRPPMVATTAGASGLAAARQTGGAVAGAGQTVSGGRAPAVARAGHTVVTGAPGTAPGTITTGGTVVPPPPPAPAPGTVARGAPSAPAPAPATAGPGGVPPGGGAPMFAAVKAAGDEPRIEGADLLDLELADLIGVEDVLDPPQAPRRAVLTAGGFLLLTLLVAIFGVAGAPRDEQLRPGEVFLHGYDVASGDRAEVDLSEDVIVRVLDPGLAARVDGVELGFGYVGGALTTASAPLRDGVAEVDPAIAQRLVGGKATATLTLRRGDTVVREHDVPIRATQTWFLTMPFVGGLLLLLLGLANLESSLKPLRSGRRRRLSYVSAPLSGAIVGASFVLLAGAFGAAEPAVPGFVVTALLGAAWGVACVPARIGLARRRRVQKAVRRAEKALGVRVTGDTARISGNQC